MLGLFKKKSPIDKLYTKYDKLIAEAHQLSTSDRAASDIKRAEAEAVMDEIKALEANKK